MKKTSKNKYTFVSVINDIPLIKEVYNELIRSGFEKNQALELTMMFIKLVLK